MTIAHEIKHIRKETGITQRLLGSLVGVLDQTVSNWERGIGEPSASQIDIIRDYYKSFKAGQ